MALTNFGQGPTTQTIDLSTDYGASLAATTTVTPATAHANSPLVTGGPYADEAELQLILSGSWALTATAQLQAVILPSDITDTDYGDAYLTSGGVLAPYNSALYVSWPLDAVTYPANTLFRLRFGWHVMPSFKTAIYNGSSVAMPLTSAKLILWGAGGA